MILVKLGGSVLTVKGERPVVRRKVVERLARELSGPPVVIVHGAGSFGHPQAKRAFGHRGIEVGALAETHRLVRKLNIELLKALQEAGLPAVTLSPHALARCRGGELAGFDAAPFRTALKAGLVPVTHGDVVPDDTRGFSIVSGDRFTAVLAGELSPDLVLFVTDVDGLFDRDPKRTKGARLLPEVSDPSVVEAGGAVGTDVTGGMGGKLASIIEAARSCDCMVVNGLVEGRVAEVLKGGKVIGTRVRRR